MDYIDYSARNQNFGLYVADPTYYKFSFLLIYDKGIWCQTFCPVDNQKVAIENTHIVIAVRVYGHKDCGRRMLNIKSVEVEPYVFIALCWTRKSCNHFFNLTIGIL